MSKRPPLLFRRPRCWRLRYYRFSVRVAAGSARPTPIRPSTLPQALDAWRDGDHRFRDQPEPAHHRCRPYMERRIPLVRYEVGHDQIRGL